MGRVGHKLGIQFVISVGDNFYQAGLKGPHDPKFKNSFSKVYTARSLQTQWFAGTTAVPKTEVLIRSIVAFEGAFVSIFCAVVCTIVAQIDSFQPRGDAVLGNHDYLGDTLLQIGDALTQKDSRWFCQRSYQLKYSLCGPSHQGNLRPLLPQFTSEASPSRVLVRSP